MRNVIIFGVNQFAELLNYFLLESNEYNICAFTIDEKYYKESSFCDKPVIPFEKLVDYYNPTDYSMFICLGYSQMNQLRELKFKEVKAKGYRILSYIHPTAIVSTQVLGEGNIIMEGVVIGAFCKVGSGNIFWARSHIAHHTEIGDFNFFTISVAIAGNIKINNNCFFGNNCTVKNDIEIKDYTLIGAGAYISNDTEEGAVYVPSKSVKLLNKNSLDLNLTNKRNK